jgi:hypothetical protein
MNMSYRNDHDAALLRIEALEHELGEAHSEEAKAHLAAVEQELATARADRDRMRARLRRRRPAAVWAGAVLVIAGAIGMASRGKAAAPVVAAIEPVAVVPIVVTRPTANGALISCVDALDQAVGAGASSGATCIAAIRTQAADPTLGDDVQEVLGRWLASEVALVSDPADHAERDRLAPRVKAVVLPSFTR